MIDYIFFSRDFIYVSHPLCTKNGQQSFMSSINMPEAGTTSLSFGNAAIQDPLTYPNAGHQTLEGGIGIAGFSPFPSAAIGNESWTPTFDPSLMSGFGFTGPSVLTPNQFFFPSTDVWSQDPLMMNSSWLLSPVPMDQTQLLPNTGLGIETVVPNTLEPVSNVDQTFGTLSLNGLPTLNNAHVVGVAPVQDIIPVDNTSQSSVLPSTVNPPPVQDSKPKSWAAIASQPAKPKPIPPKPTPQPKEEPLRKPNERSRSNQGRGHHQAPPTVLSSSSSHGNVNGSGPKRNNSKGEVSQRKLDVVSKLKSENSYNPTELTLNLNNARYFVIKSYAEDDIHRSIKYNVWCSTEHGNRRLDSAYKEQRSRNGAVYLFFSVNGSGHFCGVAQMISEVDLINETGIWTQDKWKGKFDIKWIYVKDVPNGQLRHVRLENNENKPVTNSRDTQEVPIDKGKLVMKVIHSYSHTTSIFDDFEHYEKRQEEETTPPEVSTSGSKKVFNLHVVQTISFHHIVHK